MNNPLTIYLSGPMCYVSDYTRNAWRDNLLTKYKDKYVFLDPRRRQLTDTNLKEVVEEDKKDIEKADVLLLRYVFPSVGTSMEVLYAYERKIPIVCVSVKEIFKPIWLLYHITHLAETWEEGFSIIDNLKI